MDCSSIPSDMRDLLLDKQFADLIDEMDNEDFKLLLEIIEESKDCVCGCRGRSHITVNDTRRRLLSKPRRQSAAAGAKGQVRV